MFEEKGALGVAAPELRWAHVRSAWAACRGSAPVRVTPVPSQGTSRVRQDTGAPVSRGKPFLGAQGFTGAVELGGTRESNTLRFIHG